MKANIISSVVITQLQRAIMRILGLPCDNVACVFIVVQGAPDGSTHSRIGSIGLDEDGIRSVIGTALETVGGPPIETRTLSALGDPD